MKAIQAVFLFIILSSAALQAQHDVLTIHENGHVGVHTSSPVTPLDVKGTVHVQGKLIFGGSWQSDQDISAASIQENGYDLLPVGSIVMWDSTKLPNDNWEICDGTTYGDVRTPDLRGQFIVGAGKRSNNGDQSDSYKMIFSLNDHGGSPEIALDMDEMPKHSHVIGKTDFKFEYFTGLKISTEAKLTKGKNISTHLQTSLDYSGSGENIPNIPPYYCLFYIMKVK